MDPELHKDLTNRIHMMRNASGFFYAMAQQAGVHPFIEFCGFMNEYINLCEDALAKGIDFSMVSAHNGSTTPLPFFEYRIAYLGEKFGCIFEPWFTANPKAVLPFFRQAGIVVPEPSAEAEIE